MTNVGLHDCIAGLYCRTVGSFNCYLHYTFPSWLPLLYYHVKIVGKSVCVVLVFLSVPLLLAAICITSLPSLLSLSPHLSRKCGKILIMEISASCQVVRLHRYYLKIVFINCLLCCIKFLFL